MISNGKDIEVLKKNFLTLGEKLGFIVPVPSQDRVSEATSTTPTLLLERARGKLYPVEWLFNPDIIMKPSTSPIPLSQYTNRYPSQALFELSYIKMMTPLLEDTGTSNSGIRVLFTGYDELTHTDYAVIYSDEKTLGIHLEDSYQDKQDMQDQAMQDQAMQDQDHFSDLLNNDFENPFADSGLEVDKTDEEDELAKLFSDSSTDNSVPYSGYMNTYEDFFMVVHLVPDNRRNFLHWVLIDFNFGIGDRMFAITDDYLNHLYRVVYNTSNYSLPSNRDLEPYVFYNQEGWKLEIETQYQPTQGKVTKQEGKSSIKGQRNERKPTDKGKPTDKVNSTDKGKGTDKGNKPTDKVKSTDKGNKA